MAKKQFKAESKRLLDLMVNSIYTHREIFLRELISNASDAIDKLYYHALTGGDTGLNRDDFFIAIEPDAAGRRLVIRDNGCGMTREELENNLGVIAKSGSLAFKQEQPGNENIDIIGQFGVGFYSAFMVSSTVEVVSRAYGSEEAWKWTSSGADGYTVEPCQKEDGHGTTITLTIKENTEEDRYDEFLDPMYLRQLVKKYSDYIRYPIRMPMPKHRLKEGTENEFEDVTEVETLNSMVPIWRKSASEVTQEELDSFYREKFMDYEPPMRTIRSSTEGTATYQALLFIPAHTPYGYYTKDYEKGLQLYASGVLIMERCADLLPDYFSFVKGLVDSQDLSLNISREMLQHDRQLKLIAGRLEKKIQSELKSMLANDRETYEKFWKNFGLQLKYGAYSDYGAHKELLQDLLLFASSQEEGGLTTLAEYAGRMKEGQKYIYYACAENAERASHLPQTEVLRDQGYEILYLSDDIDEFALKMMRDYGDKEFRSVSDSDLGVEDDAKQEELKKASEEHKDLLEEMQKALEGKVAEVKLSGRLKSHPVCLSTEGALSLEMEKVLNAMPGDSPVKAKLVMELNAGHPVFDTLCRLMASEEGRKKVDIYAQLLYQQALLIEGMPLEDPVEFSNQICQLMQED